MKLSDPRPLARRRLALFFLAILLPALVVGYLSLRAVTERREATRRILESHLYVSGEAAVRSIEAVLLEREKAALQPGHFARLRGVGGRRPGPTTTPADARSAASTFPGTPFLLDDQLLIVVPETGIDSPALSPASEVAPAGEFFGMLRRAETLEHSTKDFGRAARAYRDAAARATTDREKAVALAGLGRCLMATADLDEARRIYGELSTKYGRVRDQAGHFFGLTAAFQIHEIQRRRKARADGLRALLAVYRALREGEWPVSRPEFDFLASELQSLVEADLQAIDAPELANDYRALKARASPYLDALVFAAFLRSDVVPRIEERLSAAPDRSGPEPSPRRFLLRSGDTYRLVSYSRLPRFDREKTYCGGFSWDLDSLERDLLPQTLAELSKKTGLKLETIDDDGARSAQGADQAAGDALLLSFREFPVPWRLRVTQPEVEALEGSARREVLVYGSLFAFIVVLMLLGAVLLARDISRESETTRLRTEFVHNVSHELKTPLTLIRLYGETLQRKRNLTEDEKRESYEIITKESERLSHLINNVLDSARIDMGRKEFHFVRGSLPDAVRETLASYRYHLDKKGFQVHEEIAPDLPETNFDREAIAGALVNLLTNAMKFSADRKQIAVRLFRRGGTAVIQVEDAGIGIAKQDLNAVFTRFYRARTSIVSGTHGSGLGLTLVKHTAEAHGGSVEVESETGKGSVFSVILPIAAAETGDAT